jgi:hypothetical protein
VRNEDGEGIGFTCTHFLGWSYHWLALLTYMSTYLYILVMNETDSLHIAYCMATTIGRLSC